MSVPLYHVLGLEPLQQDSLATIVFNAHGMYALRCLESASELADNEQIKYRHSLYMKSFEKCTDLMLQLSEKPRQKRVFFFSKSMMVYIRQALSIYLKEENALTHAEQQDADRYHTFLKNLVEESFQYEYTNEEIKKLGAK